MKTKFQFAAAALMPLAAAFALFFGTSSANAQGRDGLPPGHQTKCLERCDVRFDECLERAAQDGKLTPGDIHACERADEECRESCE